MSRPSATTDRLPPCDLAAEKSVLGCILLGGGALDEAEERITGVEFYDLKNRTIYEAILGLRDSEAEVNLITLRHRLALDGLIDGVGGAAYLNELSDSATSPAGVGYFVDAVLNAYRLRGLIRMCSDYVGRAYECNGEAQELIAEFGQQATGINGDESRGFADVKRVLIDLIDDYGKAFEGKLPMGLPTGFVDLDYTMGGLMPQEMIVIAGSPSSGKTTLALNVAVSAAEKGITVGILSLETSAKKIVHRMMSAKGGYNGSDMLRGQASEREIVKATNAAGKLQALGSKLIICDDGGMTIARLGSRMRRMHRQGARLFIIDYLQLIQARGDSQEQQVTASAHAIKSLAKELDCPVIVISSINREASKANRQPQLSDLRGSGNIEFDADRVLLLWSEDSTGEARDVECCVAKNKDGPTGTVHLILLPFFFRFESAAKISRDDVPVPYKD